MRELIIKKCKDLEKKLKSSGISFKLTESFEEASNEAIITIFEVLITQDYLVNTDFTTPVDSDKIIKELNEMGIEVKFGDNNEKSM